MYLHSGVFPRLPSDLISTIAYQQYNHNDNDKEFKDNERSQAQVEQTRKRIKLIIGILVFIIILGSSILSKLSILFMMSHIGVNRKVSYCNKRSPNEELYATIPDKERISWIWAIIFAYAIPELVVLAKACLASFHKNAKRSGLTEFTVVFCIETLHVIGLSLLVFIIFPNLNVIQCVMLTNCISFGPALLSICGKSKKLNSFINMMAICGQITGFILWPVKSDTTIIWCTPAALILISFHWWENFAMDSKFVSLKNLKRKIDQTRSSISMYVSPWKIFVFLNCAIYYSNIPLNEFLGQSITTWRYHRIEITNPNNTLIELVYSSPSAIYWTVLIQIASSFVCYVFTRFACKIKIETFSFTLPIHLTVPMSICILLILCGARASNVCIYHNMLPDFLFFIPPPVYNLREYMFGEFGWIWIFWILSQTWITRHTWTSNSDESTNNLFMTPLYNGLIIDSSLVLNRRHYIPIKVSKENKTDSDDEIPRLYVSATMWHENTNEIVMFLKSVLRLDADQGALQQDKTDDNYYKLQTHIFFDDAFINDHINKYVERFIDSIPIAIQEVYKRQMYIAQPNMCKTPYGSQLVWTLPGQTKMLLHLKDSNLILKKKRWSQVMYMRYFLEHKIDQHMSKERKLIQLKNTFILALDGDIDFQPEAVHILVKRMKADNNIGAACGRIHPTGNGPIAWYQKFEYAIAHWLQKATEHVLGCVLCAPGCFSLYRGTALVDQVINNYSIKSTESNHFVQYDQGEDRWLSTLILKAGFRIAYSASSKAYTRCPNTFEGIFKQRLRWITSTIANIFDFLCDAHYIIRENESISMLYIIYQILLLIGTIFGPGTIFLMMIGGLSSVFNISISIAFFWNLLPIVIFMIICYKFPKYQITVAVFLSGMYSLIMITVLIAVIIQFMRDGILSPSSIFFTMVIGQFLIAAVLHPDEFGCLPYGIMYYMTIPTMYMLLIIYAIFNMNSSSWGTRDRRNEENLTGLQNSARCRHCSNFEISNSKATSASLILAEKNKDTLTDRENCSWYNERELEVNEFEFWSTIQRQFKPNNGSADDLKLKLESLRDSCAFQFVMLNAIFVVIVFICQLNKDFLYIQWPLGQQIMIYIDDITFDIAIVRKYLEIEPFGFLFIIFFGLILIIQFVAMLVHRFSTMCEVLASTELGWNYKAKNSKQKFNNFVHFVRTYQMSQQMSDNSDQMNGNEQKCQDHSNLVINANRNCNEVSKEHAIGLKY